MQQAAHPLAEPGPCGRRSPLVKAGSQLVDECDHRSALVGFVVETPGVRHARIVAGALVCGALTKLVCVVGQPQRPVGASCHASGAGEPFPLGIRDEELAADAFASGAERHFRPREQVEHLAPPEARRRQRGIGQRCHAPSEASVDRLRQRARRPAVAVDAGCFELFLEDAAVRLIRAVEHRDAVR